MNELRNSGSPTKALHLERFSRASTFETNSQITHTNKIQRTSL